MASLNFKSRRHCCGFSVHAVTCVLKRDRLKFINIFMINFEHVLRGLWIQYTGYLRILLAYPEIYESGLR